MKETMKNLLMIFGVLFVLIVGYVIVTDYMDSKEIVSPVPASAFPTQSPAVTKYMTAYKSEYMEACNEDGGIFNYCSCTYDYMVDTYGVKQVISMSMDYVEDDAELPDELLEAVGECLYLYPN